MATRVLRPMRTVLRRMHEHPSGRVDAEYGRVHAVTICDVPTPASFTGRVLEHMGDVRPGCYGAYCRQCKVWSEYRPARVAARP